MTFLLEVYRPEGRELVVLGDARVTLGKDKSNAVVIPGDRQVSRTHAVFEPYPTGWSIKDLGARNGTFVNGERIWGERLLRHGDEIRVGRTRLVFRSDAPTRATMTEGSEPPPELTRREREVLEALCAPIASSDVFTEPASIKDIAEKLFVTEAAVKQHLVRLYDKFGIHEDQERRRVKLANEAIRRGAVAIGDLRSAPEAGPA